MGSQVLRTAVRNILDAEKKQLTRKSLIGKFRNIAEEDTDLNDREQDVLLGMYEFAWDAADLRLMADEVRMRLARIGGVIDYLRCMGRIRDDEDLWMLMNEIEAYADRQEM